jgi:microcystin degradation protein MlrC
MKFFTALLATETNTFVSAPTGLGSFEEYGIFHGDSSTRDASGYGMFAVEVRKQLAAEGHEMVESLLAFAQPLGRTVRPVYESLRDEILDDLRKAGPVDGVILVLHGAMVADGCDDCEGDLISRVRAIVGPKVTIGVSLDLHCHFTQQMLSESDVIICYKEYPHTDALDRLRELVRIVVDTAQGRVQPVTAVHDCRMVGKWHTTREPMAGFVRRMEACEKLPGVLSVSLGHGFPWADVPESGAKLWVVTDNDPALAAKLADELGREFWDLRHRTGVPSLSIDETLDQAMATPDGPVVIADTADNAGGGATSDSTFVLRAVIERGIADVAFGGVWDLGAVQLCRERGRRRQLRAAAGRQVRPGLGRPDRPARDRQGRAGGAFAARPGGRQPHAHGPLRVGAGGERGGHRAHQQAQPGHRVRPLHRPWHRPGNQEAGRGEVGAALPCGVRPDRQVGALRVDAGRAEHRLRQPAVPRARPRLLAARGSAETRRAGIAVVGGRSPDARTR